MSTSTGALLGVSGLRARRVGDDRGERLRDLDLSVETGTVHVVLGLPESGVDDVGPALMGAPGIELTAGRIILSGDDVRTWPTDLRAGAGLFLARPSGPDLPGVTAATVLQRALATHSSQEPSVRDVRASVDTWTTRLSTCTARPALGRALVDLAVLGPRVAIVDLTDPTLDLSALRATARDLGTIRVAHPELATIVTACDARLLRELEVTRVHLLVEGRVATSGGHSLASQLIEDGVESYRPVGAPIS